MAAVKKAAPGAAHALDCVTVQPTPGQPLFGVKGKLKNREVKSAPDAWMLDYVIHGGSRIRSSFFGNGVGTKVCGICR